MSACGTNWTYRRRALRSAHRSEADSMRNMRLLLSLTHKRELRFFELLAGGASSGKRSFYDALNSGA
jgi:hypothetical protein